ncbi:hypothetical protein [Paenibacillus ginsengihumi]|uniref:hypothetical protein n=1 Tax=Paenibacillus ginsengihumi TaxID=431596 RepID=UPI000365B583|nr:hypothetical protein [Paenibacillus ginsengihumi]
MDKREINRLKSVFRSIRIPCNFGFAGELYIDLDALGKEVHLPLMIKKRYLTEDIIAGKAYNRTSRYYYKDFHDIIRVMEQVQADYSTIYELNLEERVKRYLLFTVIEYLMISTAKIMYLYYIQNEDKLYDESKAYLSLLWRNLIRLCFEDSIPPAPIIGLASHSKYALENNFASTRNYAEMDNKLVLFIDFFLFREEIKQFDLIISPLFGGVMIPFCYSSLSDYFSTEPCKKAECEFLSFSLYDNAQSDRQFHLLNEKLRLLRKNYSKDVKVLLVDDNIGSGRTLQLLKTVVFTHFTHVRIKAVEYHWEKKLLRENVACNEIFQAHQIDFLSPLMYRHYLILEKYIEGLISNHCTYSNYFPSSIDQYLSLDEFKLKSRNEQVIKTLLDKSTLLQFARRVNGLQSRKGC